MTDMWDVAYRLYPRLPEAELFRRIRDYDAAALAAALAGDSNRERDLTWKVSALEDEVRRRLA